MCHESFLSANKKNQTVGRNNLNQHISEQSSSLKQNKHNFKLGGGASSIRSRILVSNQWSELVLPDSGRTNQCFQKPLFLFISAGERRSAESSSTQYRRKGRHRIPVPTKYIQKSRLHSPVQKYVTEHAPTPHTHTFYS